MKTYKSIDEALEAKFIELQDATFINGEPEDYPVTIEYDSYKLFETITVTKMIATTKEHYVWKPARISCNGKEIVF